MTQHSSVSATALVAIRKRVCRSTKKGDRTMSDKVLKTYRRQQTDFTGSLLRMSKRASMESSIKQNSKKYINWISSRGAKRKVMPPLVKNTRYTPKVVARQPFDACTTPALFAPLDSFCGCSTTHSKLVEV
ncbi:hypothetical protein M0R45_005654 [Rubus argutus]|uniref:Uncharacterized protein n=1 Tax=Rubus argutus TaxID=59490 RepID=A0AAW1YNR4_RUBAR